MMTAGGGRPLAGRKQHEMIRRLALALAVLATFWVGGNVPALGGHGGHNHALPMVAHAQADPTCSVVPLGALPPARPTWCSATTSGSSTFVSGANSWLDNWEHGLSNASLGDGYVASKFGGIGRAVHWRHLNHWMVDVEGNNAKGGGLMRPNRSFKAEAGKLIIETEVATSIETYGDSGNPGSDIWPEIVVTTAPALTRARPDPLYAYDEFANHWTFGCRLQGSKVPTCAIFDNTAGGPGQGARKYEISWFQHGGTSAFGGHPSIGNIGAAWKSCDRPDDPDVICRNVFRFELTATSVKLLVNGVRYFEQTGLPPHLQNLVGGQDVYIYMADVVFQMPKVVRFHWDHLAVNPGSAGPPATATPTRTSTPASTATNTPTVAPSSTATLTPTPSAATCEVRIRLGGTEMWLAKPPEFCF